MPYINVRDAAAQLGISAPTLRRWAKAGTVPCIQYPSPPNRRRTGNIYFTPGHIVQIKSLLGLREPLQNGESHA